MATKNVPARFDCYAHAKPDEPMFILLARDPSAPTLVRSWSGQREMDIEGGTRPESDRAMVEEARQCARDMEAWRAANWPQRKNDGTEHQPPPSAGAVPEGWQPSGEQIKHMVDRFLAWRLPDDFNPDGGISFKPTFNDHLPQPMKREPTGTNLFGANQAEAMVRYMVEGMLAPVPSPDTKGEDAERRWFETDRQISHEEAREVARRLISGSFRRDGERLDSEHCPRFSIPTRVDHDDDCLIISYINQTERRLAAPQGAEAKPVAYIAPRFLHAGASIDEHIGAARLWPEPPDPSYVGLYAHPTDPAAIRREEREIVALGEVAEKFRALHVANADGESASLIMPEGLSDDERNEWIATYDRFAAALRAIRALPDQEDGL